MRILTTLFVAIAAFGVAGTSASASERGNGTLDPANGTLIAGVQYGRAPLGKAMLDGNQCSWVPAGEAATFEVGVVDVRVVDGVMQRLFLRSCPTSIVGVWVSQVSVATLASNAAVLVTQRLPKPVLGSAPLASADVVTVGMWLWTDEASYAPVSVTAWVPTLTGIAWTTTTATPVGLVFESGEPGGVPMRCVGPGERWVRGSPDDAVSDCMYAYRHSSQIDPAGRFVAHWSIVWSVGWRSNVSTGGSLGSFTTTTDVEVTVKEIQALIVP